MILLIATNAALIGLSRLTFSMGQHRQLPEILRAVHPRFKTPYVAIIVFSAIAALVMAPGKTDVPGDDLRVRRDALVHGRARLGDQAAQAAAARRSDRDGKGGSGPGGRRAASGSAASRCR